MIWVLRLSNERVIIYSNAYCGVYVKFRFKTPIDKLKERNNFKGLKNFKVKIIIWDNHKFIFINLYT